MTLDWVYLVSVESGDTPVPLSSLHTIRLFASIALQEVDHLDTSTAICGIRRATQVPTESGSRGSDIRGILKNQTACRCRSRPSLLHVPIRWPH